MNKKKKFFACSACLLGFIICSCEVMADAPDDVIISVLNNYPDYFKQNNIIFDVIRWISWLLITLLRVIANFCVTLYEYSLGLLTLISENINKFVPYAHELFTAILAISLLAMGVMLIVHPKKKPDLLLSLFLMVMALSLQTVILNPMIAPTQAAIRELSMTNSIVDRIVNSHIHDLLYIDQKLPNGLIDLASGNIDIASLTINLTDKQINNIDVNEVLNYKSNRLSEGAKGQDGILGKKLEIYYDKNEVENRELVDVDNGFGWNSEDDADFFNEFYYRYKIDSIEIIISLLAIIIVYLFMAAKVIKIVFEIVMGNIIGIYYSANLNGPQKVLQIFKEILNCFIVLLLTGVLIRMFVISETIIYELELSGLKYYFSVSLKNGMYFFTLKSKFAKSGVNHTTENHITIQHLVKAACRRNKIKDPDAKEQEKIEKVLENREKEVLNQFVNLSDIIRSMIETINEKIPDPRKWNRRLKATLFIKKFNEAVS